MKLRVRAAKVNDDRGVRWLWLAWLDPKPVPDRHWRDRCMEPGIDCINVGLFNDYGTALTAGRSVLANRGRVLP